MKNKKFYIINKGAIKEKDASLMVLESIKDIPFDVKRVFYEFKVSSNSSRGNHANRNSKFCMFAATGSCCVDVDDGKNKKSFLLDSPDSILFIDCMVWKTMHSFSKDCILFVVSDSYYDKNEYIKDYNEFIEEVNQ